MEDEVSYLLKMPSEEIMKVVLQEALKDLKITAEEQILLAGIDHDLSKHSKKIPKMDSGHPFTKEELQLLLIKQRRILREITSNTYKLAEANGTISSDEMDIYRALLRKVDEITAKKISMFVDLDLKAEPLFVFHEKIGQKFANLSATIIMNIYSEKVHKQEKKYRTIQDVFREFSSDDANLEFISRFKEVLQEFLSIPMVRPLDLINGIDRLIDEL